MTFEELVGWKDYWQRQLRLDHLDIILREAELWELRSNEIAINRVVGYSRAMVVLEPAKDRMPSQDDHFHYDREVQLVHELLHIKESEWRERPEVSKVMDEDKWLKQLHEDSLDAMAEALVRARRGQLR